MLIVIRIEERELKENNKSLLFTLTACSQQQESVCVHELQWTGRHHSSETEVTGAHQSLEWPPYGNIKKKSFGETYPVGKNMLLSACQFSLNKSLNLIEQQSELIHFNKYVLRVCMYQSLF